MCDFAIVCFGDDLIVTFLPRCNGGYAIFDDFIDIRMLANTLVLHPHASSCKGDSHLLSSAKCGSINQRGDYAVGSHDAGAEIRRETIRAKVWPFSISVIERTADCCLCNVFPRMVFFPRAASPLWW